MDETPIYDELVWEMPEQRLAFDPQLPWGLERELRRFGLSVGPVL